MTIATVGYGDIRPGNTRKLKLTHSVEKALTCILIMFGIMIYTNSISFFSKMMTDPKQMMKQKHYEIVGELYKHKLIDKKLVISISDTIENIFTNESRQKTEVWMELTDHMKPKHQLKVRNNSFRC